MTSVNENSKEIVQYSKNHKVFKPSSKILRSVPPELENDPVLQKDMEILPSNYNFEIPKSIWRIRQANAKKVYLQCPEGLVRFCEPISKILEKHAKCTVLLSSNPTYGACCVEDSDAIATACDFMIHYGHSCLVPIDKNTIPCLYVFVDIKFDAVYFLQKIQAVFPSSTKLALVSIIQFVSSLQKIASELRQIGYEVHVPQSKPLSPGEILGCTSAPIPAGYTILCLGDGRFHLESIMISNPDVEAYLYNPYSKVLSREYYDQPKMKKIRASEIEKASKVHHWGIVQGTLGRQGSQKVTDNIEKQLRDAGKEVTRLAIPEIDPEILQMYSDVEAWVQISCPRLSIDWGAGFEKPLLNPYEASVALDNAKWDKRTYPMDFYAYDSLSEWTPNHRIKKCAKSCDCK